MNEEKKKKLEEKLRQMFKLADQSKDIQHPVETKPRVIRVIRRRKGSPDVQIA